MVARESGSRNHSLHLLCCAAVAFLLFLSLTACGGGQALSLPTATGGSAGLGLLSSAQTIRGGRLATSLDATGSPEPGSLRGYVNFISPSQLAVRGPDLYISDVGTRKLYRFDSLNQVLSVVPGVNVTPQTRMQVGSDLSLYVLDAHRSVILHITRGGRLLRTLPGTDLAINLVDFYLDEPFGRIVASDQLNQRLLTLPMAGRHVNILPDAEVGAFSALGAVAGVGREMFVLDTACACIVRVTENGRVQERFGQGTLIQPRSMVADRYGRLFVADVFDRTLKVFYQGALIARFEPHQLNVVGISGMAMDGGLLYLSDGPGARVVVFRVQPPSRVANDPPQ